MKRTKNYTVVIAIVTIGLLPLRISSQIPEYPPEFSPLRTSRPHRVTRSLTPPTKFVKVKEAISNQYIVVLNDDVVPKNASLEARRTLITSIANSHALSHLGTVGFVYPTALKGYSITLPDEAAAVAISKNPQVKWVEEDCWFHVTDAQANPPWGLDAIDGSIPVGPVNTNGFTTGLYIYNATGNSVLAYVLDSGIRRTHQEFGGVFGRASIDADFIGNGDICSHTSTNNDCKGPRYVCCRDFGRQYCWRC